MSGKDLTGFLSRDEKRQLQSIYEKWLNEVVLDDLFPKLCANHLMSQDTRQRIDAAKTPRDKSMLLFHEVVMRCVYEDLGAIRRLMVETGNRANIALARMFPHRDEEINFIPPPPPTLPIQHQSTSEPYPQEENGSGERARAANNYEPPEDHNFDMFYTSLHGSAVGKGLCIVIKNFTGDLPGYNKDAEMIRNFFGDVLMYDVLEGDGYTNLSSQEFYVKLEHIKQKLSDESNKYDRFFFFILSHGLEDGILMCKQGSGSQKEECAIPHRDIVSKFTHDGVPTLKGFPKCFIFQACRGNEVAKRAGNPTDATLQPSAELEEFVPPLAVGADLLLCFPTQKNHYSFVNTWGSWYVTNVIKCMKRYYITEHVQDIMTAACHELSKHAGKAEKLQETVSQLPMVVSTLTRKFYLSIPPHLLAKR